MVERNQGHRRFSIRQWWQRVGAVGCMAAAIIIGGACFTGPDELQASGDAARPDEVPIHPLVHGTFESTFSMLPELTLGASRPGRQWTSTDCSGCHTFTTVMSHPVGVVPSMEVPDHLPLVNGEIACITCHDNSSAMLHAVARRSHDPMLRAGLEGVALCTECHDAMDVSSVSQHAQMLKRAHLEPSKTVTFFEDLARTRQGFQHDEATMNHASSSMTCLSCHDGSLARNVEHGSAGWMTSRRNRARAGGFLEGSHPVGIDYPRDSGPGSLGSRYVPRSMLDERIRLHNGQIECISCHSPYSPLRHQLVMTNVGSALCLSCHDM